MTSEATITVDNIGAINHLEFDLPKGGGVVVARGTHGSGKSTLVKAVGARLGGSTDGLQPSDGRKKGQLAIDHNGSVATLTVRASGKRNTGKLEVSSLEGRFDISTLIDPGIKDVEACEIARVKALVSLLGNVQISRSDLCDAINVPEPDAVIPLLPATDDIIAVVTQLKRELEKQARDIEATRDAQQRVVSEASASLEQEPSTDGAMTLEDAIENQTKIFQSEAEQKVRHEVWAEQKQALTEATAQLNAMHEPADITELEEENKRVCACIFALSQEIDEKTLRLRDLMEANKLTLQSIESARQLKASRDELLAKITPLADEPELTDFSLVKSAAMDDIGEAQRAIDVRQRQYALTQAQVTYKEFVRLAEAWRSSAKSCWSELFSRLPGNIVLEVFDDQLVLATDRTDREPYRELSAGERAVVAIEIAVGATEAPALLTIRQEIWDGFNDATKQFIADTAKHHGCWVLTAEISDGPLEVVTVVPDAKEEVAV